MKPSKSDMDKAREMIKEHGLEQTCIYMLEAKIEYHHFLSDKGAEDVSECVREIVRLVSADEREACADVEMIVDLFWKEHFTHRLNTKKLDECKSWVLEIAEAIAEAIRNRGKD